MARPRTAGCDRILAFRPSSDLAGKETPCCAAFTSLDVDDDRARALRACQDAALTIAVT